MFIIICKYCIVFLSTKLIKVKIALFVYVCNMNDRNGFGNFSKLSYRKLFEINIQHG